MKVVIFVSIIALCSLACEARFHGSDLQSLGTKHYFKLLNFSDGKSTEKKFKLDDTNTSDKKLDDTETTEIRVELDVETSQKSLEDSKTTAANIKLDDTNSSAGGLKEGDSDDTTPTCASKTEQK